MNLAIRDDIIQGIRDGFMIVASLFFSLDKLPRQNEEYDPYTEAWSRVTRTLDAQLTTEKDAYQIQSDDLQTALTELEKRSPGSVERILTRTEQQLAQPRIRSVRIRCIALVITSITLSLLPYFVIAALVYGAMH